MLIVLPLPVRELSPNARAHWVLKHRATKSYRQYAHAVTLSSIGRAKAPRWKKATVQATFFYQDARRRDRDNLLASLKAAFDGIADAGLVENDEGFVHQPVQVIKDPACVPHVELDIQPE